MKTVLAFSPVRMDEDVEISVKGKTIVINDEVFDFSPLPEGSELPSAAVNSLWFTGKVEFKQGALYATITLPHGVNAPEERRFPQPVTLTKSGIVALPDYDVIPVEPEYEEVEEVIEEEPDPIIDQETHEEIPV